MSHPLRVRGLKFKHHNNKLGYAKVAPSTGAWIEIDLIHLKWRRGASRTLYGCVD